jgi:hypothetical protein
MNSFSFAAVIKYTSGESVGKNSDTDLALGYANHQVGSNRGIGKMNVLVLVVNENNRGYVALVRRSLETQDSVWKSTDPAVKNWKYLYEALPVTEVMDLPTGPWKQVHYQFMKVEHRNICGNLMLQRARDRRDRLMVDLLAA